MVLKKRLLAVLACLLSGLVLSACKKVPYMLSIIGYNYTDRAVADFAVNGQGGSNVFLSTPGGGEGKNRVALS